MIVEPKQHKVVVLESFSLMGTNYKKKQVIDLFFHGAKVIEEGDARFEIAGVSSEQSSPILGIPHKYFSFNLDYFETAKA